MRYERNIAVASYTVVSIAWVYWLLDRQAFFGNTVAQSVGLGVLVLVHVALGFVVNRWWALLLPLLPVVIAIPAGYPSANRGEPPPIWLGLLLVWPAAVALAAIGVGLRDLLKRRRAG